MRLVNERDLSASERQNAWPSEQALALVREAILAGQPIEGLTELRAGLSINLDSEVLEQVERGKWWLIKAEADYIDWAMPERAFDPKVIELMQNPPAQPSRSPSVFRLVDSVTGEPLAQHHYLATVDGDTSPRRTDPVGIAHLFVSAEVRHISMEVVGV